MAPRSLLPLVLFVVLAVTGCGSSEGSSTTYVTAVNRAQSSLSRQFAALQDRAPAVSTQAQDDALLRRYESAVTAAVHDLGATHPPAAVGVLHQRFVGQLQAYGATLDQTRRALRSADTQRALAARERLRTIAWRVSSRLNAIIKVMNIELRSH